MKDADMLAACEMSFKDSPLREYAEQYLDMAKDIVVSHLFPFKDDATWADVPQKHHRRTVLIAIYLINKRGAEGEVSHSESGVSRTYESGDVPASYFRGMVPFAGVPS